MKIICPNLKNKEVAREFEELKNATSEAAAYHIWSQNNGNSIDKAPNGEPSKLFSDLLEYYNGDRVAAIQAKARTYSKSFKEWFGESKVVDENGEPLVVYHHASSPINEFSIEFDNYFSTVKDGTKKALFFTGTANPKKGTVLDREYKLPVFLKANTVIEKTGTKDDLKKQGESFTTTINRAAEEADIAIFHGIDDNQELNQDIYVINNPNNVKSIDNQGTFSTQDNNIYLADSSTQLGYSYINNNPFKTKFLEFANRLNYTITNDEGLGNFVETASKIINLTDTSNLSYATAMANVIYDLMPNDLKNSLHSFAIKKGYSNEKESIISDIIETIQDKNNKRNSSLFKKVWEFVSNFIEKIFLNRNHYYNLISDITDEMLNSNSEFYKTVIQKNYELKNLTKEDINNLPEGKIINIFMKHGFAIGGSAGLRIKGTLYRPVNEDFHDLDFAANYDSTTWKYRSILDNNWKKFRNREINSISEMRSKNFKEIQEVFEKTVLYKDLEKISSTKPTITNAGTSSQLKQMIISFDFDGLNIDIFYKNGMKIENVNDILVTDPKYALSFKLNVARDKDIRDLINFKRYDYTISNEDQLNKLTPYHNSKELLDNMDSEMATILNDVANKINMQPISIEYTDRPLNEVYPEATYWTPAIYDRNSNKIVINRNGDFSRYGSLENVLLHEIAHAITLDSLASNTEAANELRKIQKEYAEKYEDHASKNVYEFAAELFSNPEVIHNMFDFPATKGEKTLIQKIIDWFKRLFGKNTTHQDLINKIVDNVIEFNAYQTLEQREDSYDYIPDVLPAASKREEIASIKLRSVFSDMVKTAENRVASLRYNVIEDKFDRNENLRNDKLLSSLRSIQNSITDVEGVNNIANFLNGSLEYVDNVLYSLDEAEKVIKTIDEKISTAQITNDTEELTKLRTALDNFGAEYLYPHESNLRKLYNELNTEFNRNIYENILGTNEFDNILSVVDGLIREFSSKKMIDRENIGYMYGNSVRRTVEKFLRTEMEEAKDPNIDRALMNWLTFDGDLNWYHRFFATPVNSPKFVIKLLRKVIGDVNSMTHKQVYRKYAELYKAAKETRDHNLLFERDVDGKKTGYLIRDRRYGVYQNNKYKFRKDWLKNHKLASIDELKLNPSLWIQYQKDYNDWKSENCERKYTPEFYAIFTNLSMEANMALSEVNLEIDNILKPYRDSNTNKPRFERMPIDEYQKYIRLLEKKRNLANPYDPITGELKPEGSVEAQIAAELTEAYAKLQEGLESKVDMDAFLEEMERMKNIEGYTPDGSDTLYSAWLERNTRWELTDEFKEKVSRQNKKDYGEIYDRLYQARYNLLRLYRTDKFEPDYTRMPQAVKDKIKELDIAMYNVRKRTKKTASSVRLFKSELSDIAKENGGKSAVSSEDIWVDDKGVKHYASYMTKVIPVRQQYMHRVPNSNWAETSEESKFYNKNYDNSIPEAEQPKLSIKEYDNRKAYNAVMRDPALVNLRNVILDIMNEANDKITHSNYKNNYKLPQINGNIFNYWGNRGLITGTRNYMIDAFGIQPDDEIHGVKVETRPNGTEINIMPTMYTTMLTDPASGTNDLIGAIAKYYRMACNYENKKKVAPQLNLLDSLITNAGSIRQKGFTKPAASSKLADAVHTYIGYHIYGRRDILPEVTLKGYKISLDKVFEYFSRWGRDIGLSWNLRSAISGGVAAWSFYANDAFVRKHYNMHDFTIANSILTKELISLKAASQFGKNQANNKLIGALEYNGLTFNQEEDLSNTNRWRIGRMITRAAEPYSAFKLMSFLPNSAFTVSVYLNYKLIRLEDGQLHFISENDFLDNHFLNKSIEERKAIYRNAKDNLWNAYEMKDGFRVKSKYAPYVTAELEEEITAKLGSISSHAEGMVEEADKSGVHLLPALSTILMFRAFIPKNIENTISPMYWNYQTKELSMGTASAYFYGWKYGSDRKLIKLLRVLTGRNDEKLKELQEQYPDVDVKKQIDLHIRRFNAQMFTYFFWLTIFNLFGMGADDDDYWFTQFLRLELKKISLESGSRYNAMDVFDILNSITPLIQTFVDVNRAINPVSYLSSRKYEEIERGAYKGLKGWQRDFIKVIPILNAYYNMKNPREKLNDMINRIG